MGAHSRRKLRLFNEQARAYGPLSQRRSRFVLSPTGCQDNPDFVAAVKATGRRQLLIAGVVTEVCVAFPALSAIEEGFEVFVVTDASGTFDAITRQAAWDRMSAAGAQLMSWFGVACELHRDWRNDVEGLGTLFANHIPDYRNLMTSFDALSAKPGKG